MKTPLRDFVFFTETDSPVAEFFYLEPVLVQSLPHLPVELSLEPRKKTINLDSKVVSSEMNEEDIIFMDKLYGVDMKESIRETLENEMEIGIEKKILEKIIESAEANPIKKNTIKKNPNVEDFLSKYLGYVKKFNWKSNRDLVRRILLETNVIRSQSRCGGANFIIVGPKVYSYICDSPDFIFHSTHTPISNPSFIYFGGHIGSIKVLVDPKFSFSNSKIYFGISPENSHARIFCAEGKGEFIETKMQQDPREKTKISLKKMFGVDSIPSNYYSVLEIADEGKPHNLFTYILSKLKPIFKKIINPSFK